MSFLQPIILAALPLVALPIIIHLINQRRYQTVKWAAMMFLIAANRMSRGYARLRQLLILLFRVAVVAGLILAISRPLASGWVGHVAEGRADTTIILLDRSPSMQESAVGSPETKLQTGIRQLVGTLSTLGSSHWILIDSTACKPIELQSPAALTSSPSATPSSASADLPAMLQAAYDYVRTNRVGQTEIWICSDLRANDWNTQSHRWESLRDAFLRFKQSVRFHLLAYPDVAAGDLSVRVSAIRRHVTNDGAELLVSLHLAREGGNGTKVTVPVRIEIDGARSEIPIEMTGTQFDLKDHPIPLPPEHKRGSGRVSIPADVNSANNSFYFVYEDPPPRHTILVADDPQALRPQQLAAEISDDPTIECQAEVVPTSDLQGVEWAKVSLLIWQTALPQGHAAALVRSYVDRGGVVIFFPPASPDTREFAGISWKQWQTPSEETSVEMWRGDQDLLAHSQSGAALPVGELRVRRYCEIRGECTPLATLRGGAALFVRATTDHGGIYFCGTTTSPADSSIATDGVALYVAIQRALLSGSSVQGATRQLIADGSTTDPAKPWQPLAETSDALSTEYAAQSGVYLVDQQMVAVNRDPAEDVPIKVADARIAELFRGLDYERVDGSAGGKSSLVNEIWRMFLCAMLVAMVVEAGLCLPKRRRLPEAAK